MLGSSTNEYFSAVLFRPLQFVASWVESGSLAGTLLGTNFIEMQTTVYSGLQRKLWQRSSMPPVF
jgi:hypothetical protein